MEFKKELEERTKYINEVIASFLPEEEGFQKRIIEAANYSVNAGGKRLRPMIIMESCKLCGGTDMSHVHPFMAALEFIHTYSLVHDDLPAMDNDDYRRGQLTTHKKFGEDFGVLAGDALLNYAYETVFKSMAKENDAEVLKRAAVSADILSKKAGIYGMVGGQSLDVWLTDKPVNADELEYIFLNKTAALIEAAFMIGAVLAGADKEKVESLEQAGRLVGVAFQIQDDILDVTSTSEVLGKPVLSDEKNHKTTYVTLYGMEKAVKDVEDMSDKALELIRKTGENAFLEELVCSLVHRNK
jgi:geranylgeranyl diphosphate synthase type II